MNLKNSRFLILFVCLVLFFYSLAFGEILEQWTDPDAYKPNPVLFLHGFAAGNPRSWDPVRSFLNKYYNKLKFYT